MSCTQTISGLARSCDANRGGLKKVYIAPYDEGLTLTITTGAISALSQSASAPKFKAFNFRAGAASLTKTSQIDAVSGTTVIQSQLVMNFGKMDSTKRTEIMALLQGQVQVIAVDNNGTAWFLGYDTPVVAIGSQNGQTGAAGTEANQYSITLQDESGVLPFPFASATVYAEAIAEVS